eukprot:3319329-Rhodomonas_salina.3
MAANPAYTQLCSRILTVSDLVGVRVLTPECLSDLDSPKAAGVITGVDTELGEHTFTVRFDDGDEGILCLQDVLQYHIGTVPSCASMPPTWSLADVVGTQVRVQVQNSHNVSGVDQSDETDCIGMVVSAVTCDNSCDGVAGFVVRFASGRVEELTHEEILSSLDVQQTEQIADCVDADDFPEDETLLSDDSSESPAFLTQACEYEGGGEPSGTSIAYNCPSLSQHTDHSLSQLSITTSQEDNLELSGYTQAMWRLHKRKQPAHKFPGIQPLTVQIVHGSDFVGGQDTTEDVVLDDSVDGALGYIQSVFAQASRIPKAPGTRTFNAGKEAYEVKKQQQDKENEDNSGKPSQKKGRRTGFGQGQRPKRKFKVDGAVSSTSKHGQNELRSRKHAKLGSRKSGGAEAEKRAKWSKVAKQRYTVWESQAAHAKTGEDKSGSDGESDSDLSDLVVDDDADVVGGV